MYKKAYFISWREIRLWRRETTGADNALGLAYSLAILTLKLLLEVLNRYNGN